jgi:hypothetical protein
MTEQDHIRALRDQLVVLRIGAPSRTRPMTWSGNSKPKSPGLITGHHENE